MNLRRIALGVGLSCILQAAHGLEGLSLDWETAFPIAAAPEHVYFRAHYLDGNGQPHVLQVWREGARYLRRQTDSAIDLYAHRDNASEIDFRIVDHSRRVIIRADLPSLHHVGRFTGWPGLAHVLEVPHGSYVVTAFSGATTSSPVGECAWFRLETTVPSAGVNEVCWSRQWGLPLMILKTTHKDERLAQFAIDEVRVFEPDSTTFAVEAKEFLEIDARPDRDLFD